MPAGLEAHCERTLEEIVTVSQRIRRSALAWAKDGNLLTADKLCRQMEIIRISADTILLALSKASLTSDSLDERIINWLFSGEAPLCLGKLKEMDNMLKASDHVRSVSSTPRSLILSEDKLAVVMAFFDKCNSLFYFLLTPNVWNHENLLCQSPQPNALPTGEDTRQNHLQTPTVAQNDTLSRNEHSENRPLSNTNQELIARNRIILRQKLDEVSRWLAPLDCMKMHHYTLQLRQEGTCTWLPETNLFKNWRTSMPRFLWVHGKAGCGKSVLIASTIEHLKQTLRKEEVVLFFYHDFRDERSTSPTVTMRSLLSQLLRHIGDLSIDPDDLPSKILQQKSEGTLSLDNLDELCELIWRAASCLLYDPLIVIDALDESADIGALLRILAKLKLGNVRLLVTSRPDQFIMDHFKGLQSLSLETMGKEVAGDIALHIWREVDSHERLRSADSDMKEQIRAELSMKAEGRFRWIQCQLDTLKRCGSKRKLREALGSLPNELETTYERILDAIDERRSEGKMARRTLTWLAVALEPLRLSQIIQGISIDHEIMLETESVGHELIHALSSLVIHYKETDILAFSHFSVKEYLMGSAVLPMYHIVLHDAHAEVAEICMRYLSLHLKQEPSRSRIAPLQFFPTLSYILSSGFNHLAYVESQSTVFLEALTSLGLDVRHYPSHWELLCELREEHFRWPYPPWPSSRHDFVPYILIAYSPPEILLSFLFRNDPLKARVGTNPLVYAADLRKSQHAMALLECGADASAQGLVDDSHQALPLNLAIDFGDDVLVDGLLQRGCKVTPEILSMAICIPWCSIPVLVRLMQTDEFLDWAHNIGDEKLYRGIFNSARPNAGDSKRADEDRVILARILRQIGVDLSADSRFGSELIERAIHAAHVSMLEFLLPQDRPPPPRFLLIASTGDSPGTVSVVQFLLCRGVDVNAVSDGSRDSALHFAAICPLELRRLELVKLLIDAGCSPYIRNLEGRTVFEVALKREHFSVIELLLSFKFLFPSNILLVAIQEQWTLQMMQYLVRKGANMHTTTSDGDTILHVVVTRCTESTCLELIKVFMEVDFNPLVRNSAGQTVFEVAVIAGSCLVVESLLSCGVPLPSNILLIALQIHSTPKMVKHLIRGGANVHTTTPDGDTIFHLAIAGYRDSESACVRLLELFMEAGFDSFICNSKGQTAVELAIKLRSKLVMKFILSHNVPLPSDILPIALGKQSAPEMILSLIRKGADVRLTAANGDTVLHLAIVKYDEPTSLDLVQRFIHAGCNPISGNSRGQTVIEAAVKHEYTSVVQLLLSFQVPLPPQLPLTIAVKGRWTLRTIENLIQKGGDVHSVTSSGDSVLHLAIFGYPESTCLQLVRLFIGVGCDPVARNSRGRTVFESAVERGYILVVQLLLSHHVPCPPDILPIALGKFGSAPEMIKLLVREGASVHSTTSNGDTVLHLAIAEYDERACFDLVGRFINAGCQPLRCNSRGQSVLEAAIERGFVSVVQFLLSYNVTLPPDILPIALERRWTPQVIESLIRKGANVHATTSSGNTVLHLAVRRYDEPICFDLVRHFIKAGCCPNDRNFMGQTVFEAAVDRNRISVVQLLLESYGVLLPSDILPIALGKRCPAPRMIEYFIQKGANVHSTTSNGDTVLHLAITKYDERTCLDLVRKFINAGCQPFRCNFKGQSALEAAFKHGFISLVQLLLSRESDVPLPPGILPVVVEDGWASSQMVETLIRKGANVHATTSSGNTVLHLAVCRYEESICSNLVKQFIEAGCCSNSRNSVGQTVLEVAIEREYISVAHLLLSYRVPLPSDILPISLGKLRSAPRMIECLVQKGANVHSTTSDGNTVLHLAVAEYDERTCLYLVKMFINAGCSPLTRNSRGKTVLETAAGRGYASVLEMLLSSNVPLPRDILPIAVKEHWAPHTIELLIRNGADIQFTMSDGSTILHLAISEHAEPQCLNLVRTFTQAGCDPMARHSDGRTVLQAAMERGYMSVTGYLLSCSVAVPPAFDVLSDALQQRCSPQTIRFLAHEYDLVAMSESDWDTLLHLVHDSYTGVDRLWVASILNAVRQPTEEWDEYEEELEE